VGTFEVAVRPLGFFLRGIGNHVGQGAFAVEDEACWPTMWPRRCRAYLGVK
jgi:hypothetical protein